MIFYHYIFDILSKLFDGIFDNIDKYNADFIFENYMPNLDCNSDSIKEVNLII